MRKMHLTVLILLAAALLSFSGCVELTGQRVTWFYDSAKDELQILIHYDGIHDSGSDQHGKGAEQLPKFVSHGDVLMMDWPFHLQMAEVREKLQDENADPRERSWAGLFASIQSKPVGYYREPDGRIGAAQLLTIPKAKDFVRKLNDLISKEILDGPISPDDPLARTGQRMQAAAKDGHPWITLDGHAIRFAMPIHPDEWARGKGQFLEETVQQIGKALGAEGNQDERNSLRFGLQLLTSAPVSYIEEDDRVTFVVGRPKTPSTWRIFVRDEYETSLEKVVTDTVPVDLDNTLAETLCDKNVKPSSPVATILNWGPPEERVRALIAAAESRDARQRQAAIEQLRLWAAPWNRDHGVPKAPPQMDNPGDYLAAWKQWYGRIKQYPLFKEPDAAEKQEEKEDAEADGS